ncbi:MAG: DASS family sodium-coupled anion symporter [Spirochaetes bacterium]|nr:DASS family sodium-coupled anion symporter [Spirochaetota bacterium]
MSLMKNNTTKNFGYFILAVVVLIILVAVSLPQSITHITLDSAASGTQEIVLTRQGQIAMAVILFSLVLWITEAIPFHITGLLGMFLMTILQVAPYSTIVKEGFGNKIIVFFIGVLTLSAFISKSGIGKRISVFLLSKTGNDTRLIILGFLVVGALLSMWITDMAVAAMLMPLGKSILEEEGIKPLKSNFGRALMIACAWGPIIGGIGTPAGCGPNPIAIDYLSSAGIELTFLGWMMYGVPASLLLILPSWGVLLLFFPPEVKKLAKGKDELKQEFKDLPPMNKEQIVTIILFLLTAVMWISVSILKETIKDPNSFFKNIHISIPILLTTILFFLPGLKTLSWREIEADISWSGILLVVTGVSLGKMLQITKAADWIAVVLMGKIDILHPFVQILMIILIISFLKIALSSNTVTGTIIIPIMISLAQIIGLPILAITLPAAITASLAFILVTSSPTNVIPYSAGYFSIPDMAKAGTVITLISSIIVAATIYGIGLLTQLY